MTTIYKTALFLSMILIAGFFFATSAYSWPLYSKPEFRGCVIDAETKQPIEGAVVVVVYEKWEFRGPGGGDTLPFDAKETLTDKDGNFYFPSYDTFIGPLSRERDHDVSFIIFKPGYMAVDRIKGTNIPDQKYFAITKEMVGQEGEIKYVNTYLASPVTHTWKGLMGIVELKKTTPSESMSVSMPNHFDQNDLPLFHKAKKEDDTRRGLLPKGGGKR